MAFDPKDPLKKEFDSILALKCEEHDKKVIAFIGAEHFSGKGTNSIIITRSCCEDFKSKINSLLQEATEKHRKNQNE